VIGNKSFDASTQSGEGNDKGGVTGRDKVVKDEERKNKTIATFSSTMNKHMIKKCVNRYTQITKYK